MHLINQTPAEEHLLIALYSEGNFEGYQNNLFRQERPSCCGKVIALHSTRVDLVDIKLGSKKVTLLRPMCPKCGKWVEPLYHLIQ